jgi:phosphoribosylaminoimidazole-succinocarboxamide synthase
MKINSKRKNRKMKVYDNFNQLAESTQCGIGSFVVFNSELGDIIFKHADKIRSLVEKSLKDLFNKTISEATEKEITEAIKASNIENDLMSINYAIKDNFDDNDLLYIDKKLQTKYFRDIDVGKIFKEVFLPIDRQITKIETP